MTIKREIKHFVEEVNDFTKLNSHLNRQYKVEIRAPLSTMDEEVVLILFFK
jgi:hypothetical protein